MESNKPSKGSDVSGEREEGLENYSMTPDDRELIRTARERFHLMEKLDQVNREIRAITSEVSQFDGLSDETEEQFGELSRETKDLLSGLRGNVKKGFDESSNKIRKRLEGLCHQRDFIIARLTELKETNEENAEYPARTSHFRTKYGDSKMGGCAMLLVLDSMITGDNGYTNAVRREFVGREISEYKDDEKSSE